MVEIYNIGLSVSVGFLKIGFMEVIIEDFIHPIQQHE